MKTKKSFRTNIGGQAVLEGVMMRGEKSMATSVRDADGVIRVETERLKPIKEKPLIFRLPFVRGAINFFSSLVTGTKILMRSASVYGEEEPSKFEKWLSEKLKINVYDLIMFIGVALGLALAVGLFVILPQFLANLISEATSLEKSGIWYNLIEGGIRMAIFIGYILLTSLMKDIRRTYMYHGAEHKTITCYERGLPLTVENVRTCSRVHDRCGTTFMFLVMFISILVFSVANVFLTGKGYNVTGVLRVLVKIALLPVVAGISYEVLKLLAKSDFPLLYVFKAPGLLLQLITTREPDDGMIEVAITSFNTVLEMDKDESISPRKFVTAKSCDKLVAEVKEKLKTGGIEEEAEAEWLVALAANKERSKVSTCKEILSPSVVEKVEKEVEERLTGKPLWYVTGSADFYGREFFVDESVLIPRPETEELVENALKAIKDGDKVLDLCTGSGAIAVTVAKESKAEVYASDISAAALATAKKNAENLDANVTFIESDMFENIDGKFDVIISNPPYISEKDMKNLQKEVTFEPDIALFGGEDGLMFYRAIAEKAKDFLVENGKLFLECGYDQSVAITNLLTDFYTVEVIKDLEGKERIIKAELK